MKGYRHMLLGLAALSAVGCGNSIDNTTPPTPDKVAKQIEENPNMSPEQKAAAKARVDQMTQGMQQGMAQAGKGGR
jgi:hypothetical protein